MYLIVNIPNKNYIILKLLHVRCKVLTDWWPDTALAANIVYEALAIEHFCDYGELGENNINTRNTLG